MPVNIINPENGESNERAKRTKSRSPNYPQIGLEEAIGLGEKIFKNEGKNELASQLASEHIGYKKESNRISGPALAKLSALKKFGILRDLGEGQVILTEEAIKVYAYGLDSQEVRTIIASMATKPYIFAELLEKYPDLPSDKNLRGWLISEKAFNSKAAEICIKTLRETLDFVRSFTPAQVLDEIPGASNQDNKTPDNPETPTVLEPQQKLHIDRWNLEGGVAVEIRATVPLEAKHYRQISDYALFASKMIEGHPSAKNTLGNQKEGGSHSEEETCA